MPESWKNWSGGIACEPGSIAAPAHEAEVLGLVRLAAASGQTVRVVGTGHSSMPLVTTDGGIMVSLARMQGLLGVDETIPAATFRGGTKIWTIGDPLLERGYSMITMGDIDRQAIAGALGTATHGTGRSLGNISSALVQVRMVTGSGELIEFDAQSDPETFPAIRVSLGALGIITAATIRVLPAYRLHEKVERVPMDTCMAKLEEHIASNRHFEFFWHPPEDVAEMKMLNPTEDGPEAVADREGERIGWSPHIIPSVRERRFHEMEYAIPAEHGPECFARVRERMRDKHPDVGWPVEYRTVAPDDAYLSPHGGRDSVTISIHQAARLPYEDFFFDIEPIFREYGGRPHWGKVNSLGRDELRSLYPQWDAFERVRDRLDPGGVMLNPYLRGLFVSG